MNWNPNNPTREDHPAHKLVGNLMKNPWDDFEYSMIVKVDPRTSMSLHPMYRHQYWPAWARKAMDKRKAK